MKFCCLASGSSGNCEYVGSESTGILIDAGITTKRITSGLEGIGVVPGELDAILITHEHSDHIRGLEVFLNKHHIPVYATMATLDAIAEYDKKKMIDTSLFNAVKPDDNFMVGDIEVTTFSTSHDARDPICYTLTKGDSKLGMATDLGIYDDYIVSNLEGSTTLFLESNYDQSMLEVGPYPFRLKQRIKSSYGHLSNDMCARLILQLLCRGVKNIYLGHLSKENNYPALAYETVKCELNMEYGDISRFNLATAMRDAPSCMSVI